MGSISSPQLRKRFTVGGLPGLSKHLRIRKVITGTLSVAVGVSSRFTEEPLMQNLNLCLALFNRFGCAWQMPASYRKEPPRIVHLNLAFAPPTRWKIGLD